MTIGDFTKQTGTWQNLSDAGFNAGTANDTDASVWQAFENKIYEVDQVLAGGAGSVILGSGDAQQLDLASAGQRMSVFKGTAASPDTTLGPLVKATRLISHQATAIAPGDGGEALSALHGIAVGDASSQVQPVGVFGAGKNSGTTDAGTGPHPDAVGVYGKGRIIGSGIGTAIGGVFSGRRDTDTGKATGLEITTYNNTATAETLVTGGYNKLTGIWLGGVAGSAGGGAAINIGKASGRNAYEAGILLNSQGPASVVGIADYGAAPVSHLIKGSHATAALAVGAGSGKVLLGTETESFANSLLEVIGTSGQAADPLVFLGGLVGNANQSVELRNGSGRFKWFAVGAAGAYFTGTAVGDGGLQSISSGKALHLGGTTKVVSVTTANTLGFHAATPIAKPTVSGAKGSNAALASLLTALANYGLVTDSTTA